MLSCGTLETVLCSITPEVSLMKFARLIAAAAALVVSAASASAANIVDTAKSAGQFNTLRCRGGRRE